MSKHVAVEGDVMATPMSPGTYAAATGAWTPGNITYSSYSKLTIGGAPVIYEAKCTFSFNGTDSSGAPVTGNETVTLTAGGTKLQGGANSVLAMGDSVQGNFGNQLVVNTMNKLTTQ